jgi:hypothetical protein
MFFLFFKVFSFFKKDICNYEHGFIYYNPIQFLIIYYGIYYIKRKKTKKKTNKKKEQKKPHKATKKT